MRPPFKSSAVALFGCVLLAAGSARAAAPVVTGALDTFSNPDMFVCMVLNVKPRPVDGVTIELVDLFGTVMASAGPLTLLPDDMRVLQSVAPGSRGYCRVSGRFSKRKTLITFCAADSSSGKCKTAVTLP